MSFSFRLARLEDAEGILKVYAPYILHTPITFEYEVPTLEEFTMRIQDIATCYPYLVCESEGDIVGYAYAHRHQERAAYQWNAEISIYLQEKYTHLGLGRMLCAALIDLLKLQGIRNVYSCVTIPNPKSERLHHGMGFQLEGIFRNAGYKCGRWHDVAWFEKSISDYPDHPSPLLSFNHVDPEKIQQIIKAIGK